MVDGESGEEFFTRRREGREGQRCNRGDSTTKGAKLREREIKMEIPSEIKMQSEVIDKVAGAIVAAQGELSNPPKTKTVYAGQKKYSFAPLPEILDAVRPVLKKHGLAVIQLVQDRTLSTRIVHTTGQWIGSMYPLPPVSDSQAMGSAITYARRYSLCAILGIAGEDDEDGEAATEAERMEQEARRKEAEKNLDGLKGKGKVQSAYDGKVLAPGEATLPAQRAGGVATTDNGRQTADRGKGERVQGKAEGGDLKPESEKMGSGFGVQGSGRTPGKTAGLAAHALPKEQRAAETAATTPGNGIAKPLADLLRRDEITPEEFKAYYFGKGHLPKTVEPHNLPADYIAGVTKSENWKKVVAAIKGGK
jgi:hypothetical protein